MLPAQAAAKEAPHKTFDHSQCLLFAGRKGFGKTTAIREYVQRYEPRVLFIDPFDDFSFGGAAPLAPSIHDALSDLEENEVAWRRLKPPLDSTRDYGNYLFQEVVKRLRNTLLVVDEISLYTTQRASRSLETILFQGRRFGVRTIFACQRINRIPGDILSVGTEFFVFNTVRPRDLDVLEEWSGKEIADEAPYLDVGECLYSEI